MGHNLCPCCSNLPYTQCCKPLHDGREEASTPLALMRSRYAAYALGKVAYIQKTTHPKSPHFEADLAHWTQQINEFCQTTEFVKLEILRVDDHWVSFAAHLKQNGKPLILFETSYFEKVDGHWLYVSGEVSVK